MSCRLRSAWVWARRRRQAAARQPRRVAPIKVAMGGRGALRANRALTAGMGAGGAGGPRRGRGGGGRCLLPIRPARRRGQLDSPAHAAAAPFVVRAPGGPLTGADLCRTSLYTRWGRGAAACPASDWIGSVIGSVLPNLLTSTEIAWREMGRGGRWAERNGRGRLLRGATARSYDGAGRGGSIRRRAAGRCCLNCIRSAGCRARRAAGRCVGVVLRGEFCSRSRRASRAGGGSGGLGREGGDRCVGKGEHGRCSAGEFHAGPGARCGAGTHTDVPTPALHFHAFGLGPLALEPAGGSRRAHHSAVPCLLPCRGGEALGERAGSTQTKKAEQWGSVRVRGAGHDVFLPPA